jgi:hypothetical protein
VLTLRLAVTAHGEAAPNWSPIFGKKKRTARQVSRQGGYVRCRQGSDRAILSGRAVTLMEGGLDIGT